MNLTKKQKALLDFIHSFKSENGYSPSYQEAANSLGYTSRSTVHFHMENLKQKGYLDENGPKPAIPSANQLPLLGKVAAGQPLENFKHDEYIEVPSSFLQGGKRHFALQVSGDSMIDEAICDGDLLVVRNQDTAQNGQICVASINGESTLKRFYKNDQQIELHPANENYDPIIIKSTVGFKIEGVLAGVLRRVP